MVNIIDSQKLKLEHDVYELKRILEKEFIIGDVFSIGGVFDNAALRLGFAFKHNNGLIDIDMNPSDYNMDNISDDKYAKHYLCFIAEIRDLIRDYVNKELVEDAYHTLCDEKRLFSEPDTYIIDLNAIIDTVYLSRISGNSGVGPRQQYSFNKKYNIEPYDTDLFKTDFNWLITEMNNAGYNASWFTAPDSIRIKVSIPGKK
jgi:hypothetical protein